MGRTAPLSSLRMSPVQGARARRKRRSLVLSELVVSISRHGNKEGFVPYEKAMKLLEQNPEGPKEDLLPFYPLPMELPKRCKDEETRPADQLVDHPQLDNRRGDVPIKYGAAVVALSMVESTLNEWAKPEVKVRF